MSQLNNCYRDFIDSEDLVFGGLKWELISLPTPGKDFVLASYPESSWACLIGSSDGETLELNLFLKEKDKFEGDTLRLIHSKGIFLNNFSDFIGKKYRIASVTERCSKTATSFGKWTTKNTEKWQDLISAYFVC